MTRQTLAELLKDAEREYREAQAAVKRDGSDAARERYQRAGEALKAAELAALRPDDVPRA